jgi:hypothetical protein
MRYLIIGESTGASHCLGTIQIKSTVKLERVRWTARWQKLWKVASQRWGYPQERAMGQRDYNDFNAELGSQETKYSY